MKRYEVTFKDGVSMDEQDDFLELFDRLVEWVECEK
jgi:hypothetical protein